MRITQGFWAEAPAFRIQYLDLTQQVAFNFQQALTGPVAILTATVPPGRIWLIDDFYFFAKRPDPFPRLIPPGEMEDQLLLEVRFEGSNNIEYSFTFVDPTNVARAFPTMPFVNDRLGAREQRFGLWLVEGETVRATYRMPPGAVVPPATPIQDLGFRMMATQTERAYAESVMEEQR